MHPELAELKARYDMLVVDVQNGIISAQDAVATLASMTVFDGTGAQWSLNTEGAFLRAMPGDAAVVADPAHFASPTLPASPMAYHPALDGPLPANTPSMASTLDDVTPRSLDDANVHPLDAAPAPAQRRQRRELPALSDLATTAAKKGAGAALGKYRPAVVVAACVVIAAAMLTNRPVPVAPANPLPQLPSASAPADGLVNRFGSPQERVAYLIQEGATDAEIAEAVAPEALAAFTQLVAEFRSVTEAGRPRGLNGVTSGVEVTLTAEDGTTATVLVRMNEEGLVTAVER